MELVKCEIIKDDGVYFLCPKCNAHLKDVEETLKRAKPAIFLCPKCHRFFNQNDVVIPYEIANEMFPGTSEHSY